MKKIPITDYLYADSETGAQRLNCSRATRSALKAVLPQVIRRELTPQQRRCLELRFGKMMSQQEIARELHVSQPTVSRKAIWDSEALKEELAKAEQDAL